MKTRKPVKLSDHQLKFIIKRLKPFCDNKKSTNAKIIDTENVLDSKLPLFLKTIFMKNGGLDLSLSLIELRFNLNKLTQYEKNKNEVPDYLDDYYTIAIEPDGDS
ncbi:MAG: hypothetical protein GY793_01020, partial [Proteobacteria bacterium]|nr:hypothetical protein [Pseudomonadota bacterium]